MTLRLPRDLWGVYRQPPQFRFGTVTSVSPGICTVQVAGGEIPVIYFKNAAPSVGDFVSVQRQSVVSYLMTAPVAGALWVGDGALFGIWRVPTSGSDPVFYSIPSATVRGVALGPDKAIWAFGSSATGQTYVWRMVSSGPEIGDVTDAQIPYVVPYDIAPGPADSLWFSGDQYVLQVTTAFAVTEFAPAGMNQMLGIVEGPDGNLWMSEDQGYLARMTPTGVTTVFSLSGQSLGPFGICVGPDGNIWVASTGFGVWRSTLSGGTTYFPIAGSQLQNIVAGPDGNLWATDANSLVWKVTLAGDATSYSIPNSTPTGIAAGSDKNLWVSDSANGGVWQVTPAGNTAFFGLPGSAPSSICAGP